MKGGLRIVAEGVCTADRLVNEEQTNDFPAFCEQVRLAESGDLEMRDGLLKFGRAANGHLDEIRSRSPQVVAGIVSIMETFSPEHLKQLRQSVSRKVEIGPEIAKTMLFGILGLAEALFHDHPGEPRRPSWGELPDTILFRHALSMYHLSLRWIRAGGIEGVSEATLGRDVLDATHVTYATYFDGILSDDMGLIEVYETTRGMLDRVFLASSPPAGSVEG